MVQYDFALLIIKWLLLNDYIIMAASHKEKYFYQYENASARGITLIAFFVSLFIVFVAGLYYFFNILDFVLQVQVLVRIL